jgi:hypothetical protein
VNEATFSPQISKQIHTKAGIAPLQRNQSELIAHGYASSKEALFRYLMELSPLPVV